MFYLSGELLGLLEKILAASPALSGALLLLAVLSEQSHMDSCKWSLHHSVTDLEAFISTWLCILHLNRTLGAHVLMRLTLRSSLTFHVTVTGEKSHF